jgi:predicted metalloendopeptidase
MKQQDIAIVLIIVFVAGLGTFFLAGKFVSPDSAKQTAETVTAIDPNFTLPDSKYFSTNSINPTLKIEIAPGDNKNPFQDQEQ